ncbi:MAG: hypothetical protein GWO04_08620, partial [Actinobacteria bacterium]|nr:hypothetical protein [Actinomycetota bacterium]NIS30007.1 hypothetical protein [Actinomycetota bacterium]
EIEPLHDVLLICTSAEFTCSPPDGPLDARFPPLRSVMIHVRSLNAADDAATNDRLQITLDGVVFDDTRHPFELPGVYVVDTFPFQELFAERRSLIFSPSWSPDGDRLVLSDGLRLRVWA